MPGVVEIPFATRSATEIQFHTDMGRETPDDTAIHRLSIFDFLPSENALAAQRTREGAWCSSPRFGKPLGAWQSAVGRLNRQFILHAGTRQDVTRAPPDPTPPQALSHDVRWLTPLRALNVPESHEGLYELRIYTLIAGGVAQYVPLLLDALPAREKYSKNVGLWAPVSGESEQLVHIWVYRDAQHRADLRASIDADPVWQDFVPRILPLLRAMESYFLSRLL
jgi:hypothetical protein